MKKLAWRVAALVVGLASFQPGVGRVEATSPARVQAPATRPLKITTTPVIEGAEFRLDDVVKKTDVSGVVTFETATFENISARLTFVRAPDEGFTLDRFANLPRLSDPSGDVGAWFSVRKNVTFAFVDLDNRPVPSQNVESMKLKSSIGVEFAVAAADIDKPLELPALRVIPGPEGLESKQIYYTVQEVIVRGTNTVNRSQQKFYPDQVSHLAVTTQFFTVTVRARDALFDFATGDAVLLIWPDGGTSRHPIVNGVADLPLLPRGDYQMRIDGLGMVTWRPASISRDQTIELALMSAIDISSLVLAILLIASGALLVGRRNRRARRASDESESSGGDPATTVPGAAQAVVGGSAEGQQCTVLVPDSGEEAQ